MWGQVRVVVLDEPAAVERLVERSQERQESYEFVHAESLEDAVTAIEESEHPVVVVTEYGFEDDDSDVAVTAGLPGRQNGDDAHAEEVKDDVEGFEAETGGEKVVATISNETDAPVVVHTDAGSAVAAARATMAGAAAYVPKGDSSDEAAGAADAPVDVLDAIARSLDRSASREGDTREKIETLHDVATDLAACETEEELYERTIEAAEQVLEFDQCLLDIIEGELLVPVATSSGLPEGGAHTAHIDDEAVASRVARTQVATINDDLSEVTDADPAEMTYRSGFTVPVSDVGVFQAVSEELAAFDEDDLELAQLLAAHVAESLKRIRNREELQAERDRFAALFENVPDPAVRNRHNEEGEPIIEAVNSAFAETFGCDRETIAGTPLRDIVSPPDSVDTGGAKASVDDVVADVSDGRGVVAREVRRQASEGIRDFILHVIPVTEDHTEVYGIYTDITTTKERERTLERQNDRLDDFASVVSHDLRNPLTVATGNLAEYRMTGDEARLDDVEYAHERMRSLIEDLLALARSGEVVADSSVVDISTVATEAWTSVPTGGAELVLDDPPTVLADPDRLRDLFANLFRNSIEHNDADDTDPTEDDPSESDGDSSAASREVDEPVTVRVGSLSSDSGFFVEDDGVGIPESERERVFDTGYTNSTDGSGFGLAIVSQIAQAHDWTVSATAADSGGARFEFVDVELATSPDDPDSPREAGDVTDQTA